MDEVTLAYCAGIVDGEGCIRVKRVDWRKRNADMQSPAFHASVTVRMVERDCEHVERVEYVAQLDALYERSRELNAVGVTRPPGA